ncbi:hypothetical protein IF651_14050 [Cellulosimicrobium arenosum]|uniref:Uncharacterized protein n=1 Tax=Cellulosimicrobium arenosum TaxID=2708133 RepID=A0A927PFV2_9MICO|nr:hypothetical protein [Cellulosimicrobium arenosum]MBD8080177.1 hypothetical protein [Cellulosimicrobium arenosum]
MKYRTTTKQAWLTAHGTFVDEFISPELEATLPARWIPRSQAVRSGSVEVADRTAVREPQLFDSPVASVGVGVDGEPVLQLELPGGGTYDQVDIVATHRRTHTRSVLPVTVTGAADPSEVGATLVGIVTVGALEPLCAASGAIDLAIARTVDGHRGPEVRLQARIEGSGLFDPEVDPELFSGKWYATPQGNLSLRIPRKSQAAF